MIYGSAVHLPRRVMQELEVKARGTELGWWRDGGTYAICGYPVSGNWEEERRKGSLREAKARIRG
jgi:hypothetical protein